MNSTTLLGQGTYGTVAAPAPVSDDVIELSLLLPKRRAEALFDMSKRRHESVGQTLRQLIERALATEPIPIAN